MTWYKNLKHEILLLISRFKLKPSSHFGMKNHSKIIFTASREERYLRRNPLNAYIRRLTLFSLIFLLLNTSHVKAQSTSDYAIYANIIYHFTKYIDWPGSKKSGDFIIGVIGKPTLYEELVRFTGNKTVGNQKIIIKKIASSASSYNCHILFIGEDESENLKRIAERTEESSVLLVSESPGLAKKGSCINFIIIDERLRLEINKNKIEQRNMHIASELLQLGILVK